MTTICEILDQHQPARRSCKDLITFVEDRPGHDLRYAVDYGKIKQELGWAPKVSFEDGIRQTVQWYLANKDWVNSILSGEYFEYYEKHYGSRKVEQ